MDEALASRVQELVSSFGVPADKAFEVYGEIIAAGDTLLAAYTAAIDVAEEALRKSNKAEDEVEKLTNALQRNESTGCSPGELYLLLILQPLSTQPLTWC